MNKEILNKTIVVENDLIVITEETQTKKDRRQLDIDLASTQRQISNCIEQNKRLVDEYNRLLQEELSIKGMISQLPSENTIEVI